MSSANRHLLCPGPRAVRRTARGEEGAAAVEAALVLPLILLLLFGIIDFGRALQQQAVLTVAVREGARSAALNNPAPTVTSKVTAVTANAVVTSTTVCTNSSSVNPSGVAADAKVTATLTFTPLTPIFAIMQMYGPSGSFSTLQATGIMSCTG